MFVSSSHAFVIAIIVVCKLMELKHHAAGTLVTFLSSAIMRMRLYLQPFLASFLLLMVDYHKVDMEELSTNALS